MKRFIFPFIALTIVVTLLYVFAFCSSNNNTTEEGGGDVYIKPSTQICPKLPKCYNNSYPPFIGSDRSSCIKTIDKFDDSLVQQLLDANGDCDTYKSLLLDYIVAQMCKVFQQCLPADVFNKNLGGSLESCATTLKSGEPNYDLANCIYNASRNNDCNGVILCVNAANSDVGFDSIVVDAGEKLCITETASYNCENVCDKFHECTQLWCPPEAGNCTRDDCIRGCKDPVGKFTIDLMCCIGESTCEEINNKKCF